MKKIINLILIVLVAVAALSVVLYLIGGDVNGMGAKVDAMLYVAYAFLVISVILLIGMTAMNMGKGRSNSRLSLIVFGGVAVLAVVFYFALAKSTVVFGADGTPYEDVFTLKSTDAGLYLTYALLLITVVALLWGTVRKALK